MQMPGIYQLFQNTKFIILVAIMLMPIANITADATEVWAHGSNKEIKKIESGLLIASDSIQTIMMQAEGFKELNPLLGPKPGAAKVASLSLLSYLVLSFLYDTLNHDVANILHNSFLQTESINLVENTHCSAVRKCSRDYIKFFITFQF